METILRSTPWTNLLVKSVSKTQHSLPLTCPYREVRKTSSITGENSTFPKRQSSLKIERSSLVITITAITSNNLNWQQIKKFLTNLQNLTSSGKTMKMRIRLPRSSETPNMGKKMAILLIRLTNATLNFPTRSCRRLGGLMETATMRRGMCKNCRYKKL